MNPLLEEFIGESRELIESIGGTILALEEQPADRELLNGLFRSVHTMKGASGLFDIKPFTQVMHSAEEVLDLARDSKLELDSLIFDLILEVMDQVVVWLDQLQDQEELVADAAQTAAALEARLAAFLKEAPSDEGPITGSGGLAEAGPRCDWLESVTPEAWQSASAALGDEGGECLAVTYVPDEGCCFTGDDPLNSVRLLPGMQWCEVALREPLTEGPDFDPYRCVLMLRALVVGERSEVEGLLRYVPTESSIDAVGEPWLTGAEELASSAEPAPGDGQRPQGAAIGRESSVSEATAEGAADPPVLPKECPAELCEAARAVLGAQIHLLQTGIDAGSVVGVVGSIGRVVKGVLASFSLDHMDATLADALASSKAGAHDSLLQLCADIRALIAGESEESEFAEVEEEQAVPSQAAPAASSNPEAPVSASPATTAGEAGPANRAPLNPEATASASSAAAPPPPAAPFDAPAAKPAAARTKEANPVLRVDQKKIDQLMDLIGELVVAKNSLPYLAARADDEYQCRELAREIKNQYAALNRISEDLQGAVMSVRMVPLSRVFQRFPRLVRDLARKTGKEVRLEIEGEEAEVDKNSVDDLAEPLIHMIRNSIDHGIESPEEREASGKPREGVVRIAANQLDDQVMLEVADDGRGIDPERMKAKALSKGMIDEVRAASMTEQEALELILAPGFSTADQVSELSGRGVGMDVLRSMVASNGGHLSIQSEMGRGSRIRFSIPLSLAVSRVMMIEVGGDSFGVPIDSIIETVRLPSEALHRIERGEAVVLRDRLIPLLRVRGALGLSADNAEREEELVLVVRVQGEELGLVVDKVHEGVDTIVKPLEGILSGYALFSGTAILGDGRVMLEINIEELAKCL